jgi:hypothetical protein
MLIDDGPDWLPICTHGDSIPEIVEALTAVAVQAFDESRAELAGMGLSPAQIERALAEPWAAQLQHIYSAAPRIQRDMAESIGKTLPSEPEARLH